MLIEINKSLYSKTAVFKTAYHFTDEYYLYIDANSESYLVNISPKESSLKDEIKAIFLNELTAQATRELVYDSTKEIRELILGRAFATTIIEDNDEIVPTEIDEDTDGIFKDWYQNNE